MPLFRRAPRAAPPVEFTVGINDHRVLVGVPAPGCAMLDGLRGYVASVTGGPARARPDGRDSVAVLSAKMDYAELVNDASSAVSLAFVELTARGIVPAREVPPPVELPPLPQGAGTYEYIQGTHARAQARLAWLETAEDVLIRHNVAVLPPATGDPADIRRP